MKNRMEKKDLRFVKNERQIREAFIRLLMRKEFEKITVTELAKEAEINKGTFYLHYEDIYDLYYQLLLESVDEATTRISFYNDFFTEPGSFIRKFLLYSNQEMGYLENPVFKRNSYSNMMIPPIMMESLKKRILVEGRWEDTLVNKVGLEYIFSGLGNFTRREKEDKEEIEIMVQFVEDNIKKLLRCNER